MVQGLVRRQIPIFVRHARMMNEANYLPRLGCQRACELAKGMVSRSYNWTSQKYHSTANFSCDGR